jgi:RNA polymerase sigma factor (sigma-70 family)
MSPSPSDGFDSLVREAQGGSRQAMDQVLDTLRPHIEILARRYADPTKPVQSTSDLLQESCLRAWRRIGTFRGGKEDEETFAMFRAWIGQIVERLGLDAMKARDRKRRIPPKKIVPLGKRGSGDSPHEGGPIEVAGKDSTPSAYVRSNERVEKIRSLLSEITDETDATILRLYFFEGLSLRKISDQTGVSYDKVKDRYWANLERIERDLKDFI